MVVPGTPGVLLGCSKFACWGFTVNPLDVTDFFADEILATGSLPFPTHTVHDGVPEPIQAVYQSYFVNVVGDEVEDNVDRASVPLDGGGISFLVPRRYNGPIIEFLDDSTALTAQNTGLGATFEAEFIRRINQADTMEEFKEGLQFFDTGIQNVLYADRDGNIAYFTTSENPIREDLAAGTVEGLPPFFIRDGTGALNNEWLPVQNPQPHQTLPFEILPFDEMPNVTNPASGFVNNANNDPIGISLDNNTLNQLRPGGNGIYYLNAGYASGYRMGRIDRTVKSWVDSDMPITMEMMQELQGNAQMLDAELILPMLMPAFEGLQLPPEHPISQALDVLSTWDYSTPTGIPEGYELIPAEWLLDAAEIDPDNFGPSFLASCFGKREFLTAIYLQPEAFGQAAIEALEPLLVPFQAPGHVLLDLGVLRGVRVDVRALAGLVDDVVLALEGRVPRVEDRLERRVVAALPRLHGRERVLGLGLAGLRLLRLGLGLALPRLLRVGAAQEGQREQEQDGSAH